jgi:arabinose-5-phosphate isomerase
MQAEEAVLDVPVERVMTRAPKTVRAEELASAAVHVMESFGVIALPVLDDAGQVVGIVHLHDLMRAWAA